MNKLLTLAMFGIVNAALWLAHSAEADEPSTAWIVTHYNQFQLVTPTPIPVDPKIAAACTTSVKPVQLGGPHAESAISIYVNDIAGTALSTSSGFEPGAVIVKLKQRDEQHTRGRNAVGGMVKRDPGYDPSGGDWEYFYLEDGKLESGPLTSCAQCHAGAGKRDHVFASWIGASTLQQGSH